MSGSCHFRSCAATAKVYQSTHTHTQSAAAPEILTAQISTPTLEGVTEELTEMHWVRNCLIVKNKKNDSVLCSQTMADGLLKGALL